MAVDLDDDFVGNQYFEVCGYPDDEDDEAQVNQITMSVSQFAAGLVRIANMMAIQFGASGSVASRGLVSQ